MLLFCILTFAADPPKEAPTVDVVREALEPNAARLGNRRIKYVLVKTSGEPQKTPPPLDSPIRWETIATIASDGRWKTQNWSFNPAMSKEGIQAGNGRRQTTLRYSKDSKGELKPTVDINSFGPPVSNLNHLEFGMKTLVNQLGIRSSVTISPTDPSLVILNPYVDDLSPHQSRYTLDRSKDYWPIEYWSESLIKADPSRKTKSMLRAELQRTPRGRYPKQVTSWWPGGDTWNYTIVSAEFPDFFDDSEFEVAIPKGLHVRDSVTGKRYLDGKEIVNEYKPPLSDFWHDVEEIPGEDWLFYGGFVGATTLFVVGSIYLFRRARRKEQAKAISQ